MHVRLYLILMVCGFVFVAVSGCQAPPTPAPVENVIRYGDTVQGTLSQAQSHWSFIGSHDDNIAIDFTSTGSPPAVTLIGPSGESVARLSSTGHLEKFRLPDDGQYVIVIASGVGDYALVLRQVAANASTEAATAVSTAAAPVNTSASKTIGIGDSRLGTLKTADAQDIWSLNGQAGATITIQMIAKSDAIDPTLRLYAPDGSLIASNDNTGGGLNAMISGVQLPTAGTYLIQASGNGHAGDYVILVQAGTLPTPTFVSATATTIATVAPTIVAGAAEGTQVRIGQTIQGVLADPQEVDHFAIFGPAGATISVGIWPTQGSSLIPSFIMYAPNGKDVASAAGANGAIVSGYTLPSTGAYIIYVHGNQSQSSGPYILTVGDGLTLRDLDGGALTPEASYQGNLERSGDRQNWTMDLPANATLSVEGTPSGNNLLLQVEVVGPDGKRIGYSILDPATHIARIVPLVTTQAGHYKIRVNGLAGKDVGSYSLVAHVPRIEPTATFSVAVDQTIQAEVAQDERYTYSFKAVPGMVLLVEARAKVKGEFDPVVELYGPSGRRLAMNDDSSPDATDAILQVGLDDGIGAYTVQVHGYAMTPGAFTLHIATP
jgi:hypothetical protein